MNHWDYYTDVLTLQLFSIYLCSQNDDGFLRLGFKDSTLVILLISLSSGQKTDTLKYFVLSDSLFFNFYIFLSFLMGISFLANVIRRINDLKMSRWSIILGFIPILGILFVVYLVIKQGEESFNS